MLPGIISILITSFLWALNPVFSRTIGYSIPIFYMSIIRGFFVIFLLMMILFIRGKWKNIALSDYSWYYLRAIAGFFSFFGIYIAFIHLPVGTGMFVTFAASTIGAFIFGKLFFNEKIKKINWISLLMSMIGLGIIYTVEFSPEKMPYLISALIGGLGTAIWNIVPIKLAGKYSEEELMLIDNIFILTILIPLSVYLNESWNSFSFNSIAWSMNLFMGIQILLATYFSIYGFYKLKSQYASIISLSEILFGIAIGFFLYSETVSTMDLIGGIMIILAAAIYRK